MIKVSSGESKICPKSRVPTAGEFLTEAIGFQECRFSEEGCGLYDHAGSVGHSPEAPEIGEERQPHPALCLIHKAVTVQHVGRGVGNEPIRNLAEASGQVQI